MKFIRPYSHIVEIVYILVLQILYDIIVEIIKLIPYSELDFSLKYLQRDFLNVIPKKIKKFIHFIEIVL